MEPAQIPNEVYYLKQIIDLKNEIIKLQKELLEKDKIMKIDKERIEELEKKLNEIKSKQNSINPRLITTKGSFDILKKEPIIKIDDGTCYSIYFLEDGRLAATTSSSIIIYNNETFKSEMTIKEHSDSIYFLTQLSNGNLVSVGSEGNINIYSLLEDSKYIVLQKKKPHDKTIYKLREYDNDRFMTCSKDCSIKFFFKNKNEYCEDYTYKDEAKDNNYGIYNILKTKEDEIVYIYNAYTYYNNTSYYYYYIKFYDLKSRKIIDSISINDFSRGINDSLYMINKNYLLVGTKNSIELFDVNQRRQIKSIKSDNSDYVLTFMKINDNTLLSGDSEGKIKQWIIDDDNLILESTKENAHNKNKIYMITKRNDGLVISASNDIKGWA